MVGVMVKVGYVTFRSPQPRTHMGTSAQNVANQNRRLGLLLGEKLPRLFCGWKYLSSFLFFRR